MKLTETTLQRSTRLRAKYCDWYSIKDSTALQAAGVFTSEQAYNVACRHSIQRLAGYCVFSTYKTLRTKLP